MRISDWSSDVCSSDLVENAVAAGYPSYPDVDVTSILSNPDYLISIHVLRIEAYSRKLQTLVGAPSGELIFPETVSRLAADVIPTLRHIRVQLQIETITAARPTQRGANTKLRLRQQDYNTTELG